MRWWHLTIAALNRETSFVDRERQLAAVRAIARVLGHHVLLFCVVDDHLHVVCEGSREEVGRLAGCLSQALSKGIGGTFEAGRISEVKGRAHLENLVSYVLRQTIHHGLGVHPAAWAGSCLADLLGARIVERFDPQRLALALPRREIESMALFAVGLDETPLDPAPADPEALWRAAGAAIGCIAPTRRTPLELGARQAFAHLARDLSGARDAAGLPVRSWHRLLATPPDPRLVSAIERNVALDRRIAAAAAPEPAWRPDRAGVHLSPAA